jgi:acetyltransferase-like isoleucine patch superfamily enzyme
MDKPTFISHQTASVSDNARIGEGTRIWNQAQVRENVHIGQNCIIGKDVYIDFSVEIGDNVKIQNGALIYHGTTIESGVFVGPGVIFTNDKKPRAVNPDGTLKGNDDWEVGSTRVCFGASVGAGSVILPGVTIGSFSLVGAGAVVTRDVPPHGLMMGNPARLAGYVCKCASRLVEDGGGQFHCPECGERFELGEQYEAAR